jgi:DedD protein
LALIFNGLQPLKMLAHPCAKETLNKSEFLCFGGIVQERLTMDKALKQRLVGASVLIALAVIVLPMMFSGRPESFSQQSQKIELPPQPGELSFETRRFPVTDPQQNVQPAVNRDAVSTNRLPSVPSAPADQAAPEKTQEVPQAGSDDTPDQAPMDTTPGNSGLAPSAPSSTGPVQGVETKSPDPDSPAASATGRYVVQVASLGSAENASRLMTSLRQHGFPVLLDDISSDVGQINRVRVGPYQNETEATQASARIGAELEGVSPRVVDLQPDESAPATRPADPLVRWVVQVGSFADASNAERLVTQIREAGMSAYGETLTSSATSIFRVRVGPFLEREEALRIKQQLADRLSVDGVVMSVD